MKSTANNKIFELASLLSDAQRTPDTTDGFDTEDIDKNRTYSILAYLGILIAVPMFFAKESPFARFHTRQGLILLISEVLYALVFGFIRGILLQMSWRMGFVINALGIFCIFFFILIVLSISNAISGKAKSLPLLGRIEIFKK
jgi:uncharacterized membrane protein